MDDRQLWIAIREALLRVVDAIERRFGISPRTAEIRRWYKENREIVDSIIDDKNNK